MRRLPLAVLALAVFFAAGCGPKAVTPLQRKQAATLASEANFATTVRDYPRAEGLYAQAAEIAPDMPEYWLLLGTVRRKMDNRDGARTAFERALKVSRAAYKQDPTKTTLLLQQAYLYALMGKPDDARETVEKARKEHPEDRTIRTFVEGKELDRLLADPAFKDAAL
ncbi:MAG: hypothetical protein JWM32_1957 [Verrucomicrobia bacterium]|nr:hypothetical protein [Verrucomicrobiota bacterium]